MHNPHPCNYLYSPPCALCVMTRISGGKPEWPTEWVIYPLDIKFPLCWRYCWISTHTGHKYLPIFSHSWRSIHTLLTYISWPPIFQSCNLQAPDHSAMDHSPIIRYITVHVWPSKMSEQPDALGALHTRMILICHCPSVIPDRCYSFAAVHSWVVPAYCYVDPSINNTCMFSSTSRS